MAVIHSYFDASGSPSTAAVAVAGLVARPEKWVEFDRRWSECLAAHGVSALHMKHFAHSREEFASWKDDAPKRRRFLGGLLWIIEDLVEYTATCAVYVEDYNRFDATYRLSEFMRPYTLASLTCGGHIVSWATDAAYHKNDIVWVFEKGDTDQRDLKARWDRMYPDLGVQPILCRKSDNFPDRSCFSPIRAFEAADLIAYENLQVHKALQRESGLIHVDQLRKPLKRMESLPGAKHWGFFGQQHLQDLCSKYAVDSREPDTANSE